MVPRHTSWPGWTMRRERLSCWRSLQKIRKNSRKRGAVARNFFPGAGCWTLTCTRSKDPCPGNVGVCLLGAVFSAAKKRRSAPASGHTPPLPFGGLPRIFWLGHGGESFIPPSPSPCKTPLTGLPCLPQHVYTKSHEGRSFPLFPRVPRKRGRCPFWGKFFLEGTPGERKNGGIPVRSLPRSGERRFSELLEKRRRWRHHPLPPSRSGLLSRCHRRV